MPNRLLNFTELVPILKRYNITYVDPSELKLRDVAQLIYRSKLIISESGSQFVNYLLFAKHGTPVIQLVPSECLSPTWSFHKVNCMQWFRVLMNQIYFMPGRATDSKARDMRQNHNTPAAYDAGNLDMLIHGLLRQSREG